MEVDIEENYCMALYDLGLNVQTCSVLFRFLLISFLLNNLSNRIGFYCVRANSIIERTQSCGFHRADSIVWILLCGFHHHADSIVRIQLF